MSPDRKRRYSALARQVVRTPLWRLLRIGVPNGNRIWVKEEHLNPTESAFDRVYPPLFAFLEERGDIVPGVTPVIECSTGNAGASFAWAARELGYEATVVTHADTPLARRIQIERLGARLVLSPPNAYGAGYVQLMNELLAENRDRVRRGVIPPSQRLYAVTKILPEVRGFYAAVAEEALEQRAHVGPLGSFDFLVSAVGSGDLICGIAAGLRRAGVNIHTVAMEPSEMPAVSALLRGQPLEFAPVSVESLMLGATGNGLPAEKLNIDLSVIDQIEQVTTHEWQSMTRMLATIEDKHVGRTSAGSLVAALRLAGGIENKDILTFFYDAQWKYGEEFRPRYPELYT